jgi:hypothetical protein
MAGDSAPWADRCYIHKILRRRRLPNFGCEKSQKVGWSARYSISGSATAVTINVLNEVRKQHLDLTMKKFSNEREKPDWFCRCCLRRLKRACDR